MPKVKDIDIKKLSIPKQDFMSALRQVCRKVETKKKEK
jgi:hypothetical protein